MKSKKLYFLKSVFVVSLLFIANSIYAIKSIGDVNTAASAQLADWKLLATTGISFIMVAALVFVIVEFSQNKPKAKDHLMLWFASLAVVAIGLAVV